MVILGISLLQFFFNRIDITLETMKYLPSPQQYSRWQLSSTREGVVRILATSYLTELQK